MEWDRQESSAYNRVEQSIIVHYLEKYLPPSGVVLDAGAGSSWYTIELAKRGYEVVLQNRSKVQLEIFREDLSEQPPEVQDRVLDIVHGSIEDMSVLSSGRFDAVLCLGGRLSHLVDREARERAAGELARVTRPGGAVFVTVLSFYGALRKVLIEYPEDIHLLPDFLESRANPLRTAYPDCFFFTPEEMVDILARNGIEIVEYVGMQGLSAQLKEVTEDCYQSPERWRIWEEVLIRTCNHPSVVGISDQILAIGFI